MVVLANAALIIFQLIFTILIWLVGLITTTTTTIVVVSGEKKLKLPSRATARPAKRLSTAAV